MVLFSLYCGHLRSLFGEGKGGNSGKEDEKETRGEHNNWSDYWETRLIGGEHPLTGSQ